MQDQVDPRLRTRSSNHSQNPSEQSERPASLLHQSEASSNEQHSQAPPLEDHQSFMRWIQSQLDLQDQSKSQHQRKSLQPEKPVKASQEDEYEQFKHSHQKQASADQPHLRYFGMRALSPKKISQQMDKHLYRRIDPRKPDARQPLPTHGLSETKVQSRLHDRLKSQVKDKFTRKSTHQNSSRTRPSTSHTCNKSNHSSVPQTSRKVFVQRIQNALYESEIDFSREKESEDLEEVPDYYRPKKLLIEHIRPPKIQFLRKEFRWWPLEQLQRECLKRCIENEESDDDQQPHCIASSYRKSVQSQMNSNQQSRNQSFVHSQERRASDIGRSIHLIKKCDMYLQHSANVKKHLRQKESQFNSQFNLFELNEDETNEREYLQEQKKYEKEESNAVIVQFKQNNFRKIGQKLYSYERKKQFKAKTRQLLESMK